MMHAWQQPQALTIICTGRGETPFEGNLRHDTIQHALIDHHNSLVMTLGKSQDVFDSMG